jgi:hypothetical protein
MRTIEHLDRATSIKKLREFSHHWNALINQWNKQGLSNVERQYAQSFWQDFLACFGINGSRTALYERRAKRSNTGGAGFIDFFMPALVIGEAKSLGKDLGKAQEQVDDYLAGGSVTDAEFPKYSLVTNFQHLHLKRLDGTAPDLEINLLDVADYYDAFLFLIGKETITKKEEEEASIQAAELMAGLYTSIMGEEADLPVGQEATEDASDEDERSQQTSILMTRLLFLLYGDDANLWEADLFYRWVDEETTPSSLGAQLNQLFDVLNTPKNRRSKNIPELMAQFPYVNGSLFADSLNAEFFTPETREALLQACGFRWNRISVSVFGAMFQLVKSKEARRAAGEHYTSEKNILKTIGPLFLDDYRSRADRLISNRGTHVRDIDALLNEMASNIYCDPACGGGNFLNVAYAKMREIETDLLVERQKRGAERTASFDISFDQKLSIDQFWGFEINWWPAKIAETAMFLVDHQANLKLAQALGDAPERLPIRITAHIVHGNALQLDWAGTLPEPLGQTFLFGNPPFLGHISKSVNQRSELKNVWGEDFDGYLDYVTGWHGQALKLFADRVGEFAYVTTNSITQGQPVPALFGPIYREGWRIKFAHRTFAWDSEAPGQAAVHCVIVGFTRDNAIKQRLWEYATPKSEPLEVSVKTGVNAYLVDGPDVLVGKRSKPLSPLLPQARFGTMPIDHGNLIVEAKDYEGVMADPIAAKYVRPFRMGKELVRGLDRWCLWLEDAEPADIAKSPVLRQRVEANRVWRSAQTSKGDAFKYRDVPHLMRPNKERPLVDYVGIPRVVSETRKFYTADYLSAEVIAADSVYTAPDPDGFLFGLVSSSMFMVWQQTTGGRLESRLRFSNTLTWNNFPLPELDEKLRKQIIVAGKKVLDARALHPERSLAEHYNPLAMSPELLKAHAALDKVVDQAFGATRKLITEAQRLELLFKNYQALSRQNN